MTFALSRCSLAASFRSPEENGGLDSGSAGSSHSVYGSHASLNSSAEGPGKKQEREPKPGAQQGSDPGEAISQFELSYGSKSLWAWSRNP